MTDNRTTELLAQRLEERGLSCQTDYLHAVWRVGSKLYDAVDNFDGTLTVDNLTPEQVIAATLGNEINGDTSDGYHTFDELYYHRTALFACLVALQPRQMAFKSWKHSDGTMYEGMFIAGIYTSRGWCTYHCEAKWWPLFDCHEQEFAPEWDGHTPSDAIHRLMSDFLPSQDVSGEVSE